MLELRELRREDVPAINSWRADRNLIDCLGAPYRYIGPEVDLEWFDSYLASRSNTIRCAICDSDDERDVMGVVTLSGIDWVNRSALLSIMIGDEANRGRGVGTFAVREILRHAFSDMGINRVELLVLTDNERAVRLYEKCGFVHEGVKREFVFKNGRFVDAMLMSVLHSEWASHMMGRRAEMGNPTLSQEEPR